MSKLRPDVQRSLPGGKPVEKSSLGRWRHVCRGSSVEKSMVWFKQEEVLLVGQE